MATTAPTARATKSGLLLRDGLVFLALLGVTVALLLVTLLLFRSFENHREELGQRWSERGRLALAQGRPDIAVGALRTALTYRDDLQSQTLLAQALAAAGHTEEATNYFLTLRETRPGDGLINLQLARLKRREGDAGPAIDYYRASIYGNWEGDGVQRRREVRLELADYLASRGDTSGAKDELLIAAGNTPENEAGDVLIGDRLAAINDAGDALGFYRKALQLDPHGRAVLAKAGRLAYTMGQYDDAAKLLGRALAESGPHVAAGSARGTAATPALDPAEERQMAAMAADARRIPELRLDRDLPAAERAEHLLVASTIAQKRLAACMAPPALTPSPTGAVVAAPPPPAPENPTLQILRSRWVAAAPVLRKRILERDATLEDNVAQLINDTEQGTVQPCGAPQGDDALLLMLGNNARTTHP